MGAAVGARDGALIAAARTGQVASIRIIVAAGGDPNARAGVNGWPALMHAVHKNQTAAVRELLAPVSAAHS